MNRIRKKILGMALQPPIEFLTHEEFGPSWRIIQAQWRDVLKRFADTEYTDIQVKLRGGRLFHYDAEILYHNGKKLVATKKVEFKCSSISSKIRTIPNILSEQATAYAQFFYENYLDKYIACDNVISDNVISDNGITEKKPDLAEYLQHIGKLRYDITPFFAQLKAREPYLQAEKHAVVDRSIKEYLQSFGSTVDLAKMYEKIRATQEKTYIIWMNGKFHLDSVLNDMDTIYTGNVKAKIRDDSLELKWANMEMRMVLVWRNHKGILNPVFEWQLSARSRFAL